MVEIQGDRMINSVFNEGVRGLQASSREMQKSAQEVAEASIRDNPNTQAQGPKNAEDTEIPPVNETVKSERTGDIAEPLIELRRQEQIFTANAQVISAADEALGTLIDTRT